MNLIFGDRCFIVQPRTLQGLQASFLYGPSKNTFRKIRIFQQGANTPMNRLTFRQHSNLSKHDLIDGSNLVPPPKSIFNPGHKWCFSVFSASTIPIIPGNFEQFD
jgi:hypothetical protein